MSELIFNEALELPLQGVGGGRLFKNEKKCPTSFLIM
jgi:hypothetical protein